MNLDKISEQTILVLDNLYTPAVITNNKLEGPDNPKIEYVNEAFRKTTGYTNDEIIGQTPRLLQGEKSDRKILDNLKKQLKQGNPFEAETINYKKDGTPYNVEWNISPLKDEDGNIQHFISIQKDITQAVHNKKILKKALKKELKKRKQKDKALEKQSRYAAMGEMIDAIAHQWKQPINILKLNTEMLGLNFRNDNFCTKDIEKFQNKVYGQLDHMNNTLNEFREFFKANKKRKKHNVYELIDTVLLLLKDELLKHCITIDLDVDKNMKLKVIKNEFNHVLLNILNNAKDIFEDRSIQDRQIKITAFETKNKKIIQICDNAGGIKQEYINDIFDLNVTIKSNVQGTGVGLYLTKKIIEKVNGDIKAFNKNNGACFEISFNKNKKS